MCVLWFLHRSALGRVVQDRSSVPMRLLGGHAMWLELLPLSWDCIPRPHAAEAGRADVPEVEDPWRMCAGHQRLSPECRTGWKNRIR